MRVTDTGYPTLATPSTLAGFKEEADNPEWDYQAIDDYNAGQGTIRAVEKVGSTNQKLVDFRRGIADGLPCTFSVEVKSDGVEAIGLQMPADVQFATANFSLSDGSKITGHTSFDETTAEDLGDGWWRFTVITYSGIGAYTNNCKVLFVKSGNYVYEGDGESAILVRNPSIKYGLVSGSPAGASYGSDNVQFQNVPWGDGKGLISCCVFLGWHPSFAGPSTAPRFLETSPTSTGKRLEYLATNGNVGFITGGGARAEQTASGWDKIRPIVCLAELDGTNAIFTAPDGSTFTVPTNEVFSGVLHLGNRLAQDRFLNGVVSANYHPGGLPEGVTEDDLKATYMQGAANVIMGTNGVRYQLDVNNDLVYTDGRPTRA
jgi:hypothetical protein